MPAVNAAGAPAVQRADLDALAKLFDFASDGEDAEIWAKRFQEHIMSAMRRHSEQLRIAASPAACKLELLRAKLDLHEIVAERLETRAEHMDPIFAEALRELRAVWAPLIEEALLIQMEALHSDPKPCPMSLCRGATAKTADGKVGVLERPSNKDTMPLAKPRGQSPLRLKRSSTSVTKVHTRQSAATPSRSSGNIGRSDTFDGCDRISHQAGSVKSSGAEITPPTSPRQSHLRPMWNGSYAAIHSGNRDKIGSAPLDKELTLKEFRELMSAVLAAKALQDPGSCDAGSASSCEKTQSLEDHLHSFVSRSCGSDKNAMQERMRAIFQALDRYSTRECDVAAFGKMLKNLLPANFLLSQGKFQTTVQQLLRELLEQLHSQRSQVEIDALQRARFKHGLPLSECERVVSLAFGDQETEELVSWLRGAVSKASDTDPSAPDTVQYHAFMQAVLSYHMQRALVKIH